MDVLFNQEATRLVAACQAAPRALSMFNLDSAREPTELNGHETGVTYARLVGLNYIVSAGFDRTVRVFCAHTGRRLCTLGGAVDAAGNYNADAGANNNNNNNNNNVDNTNNNDNNNDNDNEFSNANNNNESTGATNNVASSSSAMNATSSTVDVDNSIRNAVRAQPAQFNNSSFDVSAQASANSAATNDARAPRDDSDSEDEFGMFNAITVIDPLLDDAEPLTSNNNNNNNNDGDAPRSNPVRHGRRSRYRNLNEDVANNINAHNAGGGAAAAVADAAQSDANRLHSECVQLLAPHPTKDMCAASDRTGTSYLYFIIVCEKRFFLKKTNRNGVIMGCERRKIGATNHRATPSTTTSDSHRVYRARRAHCHHRLARRSQRRRACVSTRRIVKHPSRQHVLACVSVGCHVYRSLEHRRQSFLDWIVATALACGAAVRHQSSATAALYAVEWRRER